MAPGGQVACCGGTGGVPQAVGAVLRMENRCSFPGSDETLAPVAGEVGAVLVGDRPRGDDVLVGPFSGADDTPHGDAATLLLNRTGTGECVLRSEQGLAALREVAAGDLSPAGQLQVATALDMIKDACGAARGRCAPLDPPGRSQNPAAIREGSRLRHAPSQPDHCAKPPISNYLRHRPMQVGRMWARIGHDQVLRARSDGPPGRGPSHHRIAN